MKRLCILMAAALVAMAAGRSAVNQLVVNRNAGTMCWPQKPGKTALNDADLQAIRRGDKTCPSEFIWNSGTDFFRSGDVVEAIVPHPHFLSTFTATVNVTTITEPATEIRGLTAAPAPTAGAPAPKSAFSTDDALAALRKAYSAAHLATGVLGDLLKRAQDTESDTRNALSVAGSAYTDLAAFNGFVTRTDGVVGQLNDVGAQIPAAVDAVAAYLKTVADVKASIAGKTAQATPEITDYISGTKYAEIAAFDGYSDTLNYTVQALFNHVNNLWRISQNPEPAHVILGQWPGNARVDFQITENPHFQMYSFQMGGAAQQQGAQQPNAAALAPGAKAVILPGGAGGGAKPGAAAPADAGAGQGAKAQGATTSSTASRRHSILAGTSTCTRFTSRTWYRGSSGVRCMAGSMGRRPSVLSTTTVTPSRRTGHRFT